MTERLLYDAGVIDTPGSVDDGTTRTDSDGGSRSAPPPRPSTSTTSLSTSSTPPGHQDFIAELERSLTVLDAAVLVLSSAEGIQPQTVTYRDWMDRSLSLPAHA